MSIYKFIQCYEIYEILKTFLEQNKVLDDVDNVEIRYERSTSSIVTHNGLLRSFYQTDLCGENEFDLIKVKTPISIMDNNIHWSLHYKQRG